MNNFDLNKIITHYELEPSAIAKVLFADNKYPNMALTRVLKGEADLSVSQLMTLADYLNLPIQDLFGVDDWKGTVNTDRFVITKGKYSVWINHQKGFAQIYEDLKPVSKLVLSTAAEFSEVLDTLNNIINNLENGTN